MATVGSGSVASSCWGRDRACLFVEEHAKCLQCQEEHAGLGVSAYASRKMVGRPLPVIPQIAPLLRERRKQRHLHPAPAVRDLVTPPQAAWPTVGAQLCHPLLPYVQGLLLHVLPAVPYAPPIPASVPRYCHNHSLCLPKPVRFMRIGTESYSWPGTC